MKSNGITGQGDRKPGENLDTELPRGASQPPEQTQDSRQTPANTSLYDDTLSASSGSRTWIRVVWLIVFGLVCAGIVAAFLAPSTEERIAERMKAKQETVEESTLARLMEEVRAKEAEQRAGKADRTEQPVSVEESSSPKPTSFDETDTPSPRPSRTEAGNARPKEAEIDKAQPRSVTPAAPSSERPAAEEVTVPVTDSDQTTLAQEMVEDPSVSEADSGQSLEAEDLATQEPPDPSGREAYDRLLMISPHAAKLVAGAYTTLEFLRWRVVQDTPKQTWIDLIAVWTSAKESEVHFIWAVSKSKDEVRPLSEAARNLVAAD